MSLSFYRARYHANVAIKDRSYRRLRGTLAPAAWETSKVLNCITLRYLVIIWVTLLSNVHDFIVGSDPSMRPWLTHQNLGLMALLILVQLDQVSRQELGGALNLPFSKTIICSKSVVRANNWAVEGISLRRQISSGRISTGNFQP